MTGIQFDGDGVSSDGWQEQKSLMFASDSLPDLFIASDFSAYELLEYGSEGNWSLSMISLTHMAGYPKCLCRVPSCQSYVHIG
jgi:hypothetical protein